MYTEAISDPIWELLRRLNPNVAKVEGAADLRRQGRSCSELPQALDNAGDAVSSAFPKGKQTGDFSLFVDTTDGHVF
jgi:hypothetical protein